MELKNKKATTNPMNEKYKCFQYAVTDALNHEEIKRYPQRITTIKHFINKYKWEGINFQIEKKIGKDLK